jgi:hypothetical protein
MNIHLATDPAHIKRCAPVLRELRTFLTEDQIIDRVQQQMTGLGIASKKASAEGATEIGDPTSVFNDPFSGAPSALVAFNFYILVEQVRGQQGATANWRKYLLCGGDL